MIWLLLTLCVAMGAEIEVSAKGKPVHIFLDGEKQGLTPMTITVKAGVHEITAKEDELSAAALNLKFAVFDQRDGRIRLDWKKQIVDLVWPGEEKLELRDRLLLRNRELDLARQPGMFALPPEPSSRDYKSADDLRFTREVELVMDNEVLVADEAASSDADSPRSASGEIDLDALLGVDTSAEVPAEEPEEFDLSSISFGPVDLSNIGTEASEDEDNSASVEEPVVALYEEDSALAAYEATQEVDEPDVNFNDLLDGLSETEAKSLSKTQPKVKPVREKPERPPKDRKGISPWVVGTGAAVIAAGFYGQAGLQWAMAQGYAERARNMEGSVAGVPEYEFNADYARRKSGLTRASIGVGTAVLVGGVGVTVSLGSRKR